MALYPSLYQINTRVWLRELGRHLGRPATLADIPYAFLDQAVAHLGFHDYVGFLGLRHLGLVGRQVFFESPWSGCRNSRRPFPGFTEADVSGSPFSATGYTLHRTIMFGGRPRQPERAPPKETSSSWWILSPTTRPRTIPGCRPIRGSMSRGAKPTWSESPTIIGGSRLPAAP